MGASKRFHQCWEEFRALPPHTAFLGAHKGQMQREKDLLEPPVISAEPPFLMCYPSISQGKLSEVTLLICSGAFSSSFTGQ